MTRHMSTGLLGPAIIFFFAVGFASRPAVVRAEPGANEGGTLILHTTVPADYTEGMDYCGSADLGDCTDAVTRVDTTAPVVTHVLASFRPGSGSRLVGITFGVDYTSSINLLEWQSCGDFQLPQDEWPDAGSGTAVTWATAQTEPLVEVYWISAYSLAEQPGTLALIPHPTQGGSFADDHIPSRLDPITAYANLGFFSDGNSPCPAPAPALGACCYPGGYCVLVSALDCDGGDFLGEGTSCDPNPCPLPPFGACCPGDGSCRVQVQSGCDGTFLGVGTTCEPNPCPPPSSGACCFADGTCEILGALPCSVAQGNFLADSTCDPSPCPPSTVGACCLQEGTCLLATPVVCEALEGAFEGVGTACEPNPCPGVTPGACCLVLGACDFSDDVACDRAGGEFQGAGSSCEPNPCPQPCQPFALAGRPSSTKPKPPQSPFDGVHPARALEGANHGGVLVLHTDSGIIGTEGGFENDCESPAGVEGCRDIVARSDSEEAVTLHALALFPPASSPRLMGLTFGITYPDCVQLLEWQACGDFELPNPDWPVPGSGTAVTWIEPQASFVVPVYRFAAQGLAAEPGEFALVPHPIHDAVFADDSIPSILDPIAALGSFGFFRAGVTPCPITEEVTGSCCLPDGTCSVLTFSSCEARGGSLIGLDIPCAPNPCESRGACCFGWDGSCYLTSPEACAEAGGAFLGVGRDCEPNPCGQNSGACCFGTGECWVTFRSDCTTALGTFAGEGTACEPDPCPPAGACCFENGVCTIVFASYCAELGGEFQGEDVGCAPGLCPPFGACCFPDGSCLFEPEATCESHFGDYQGDGSTCDPNPCPQPIRGACCFEDGTCAFTSVDVCTSNHGDYQGDGSTCDPNPCPQPIRGACCLADGSCRFRTVPECSQAGGVFQGDNVPCDPNPCPLPTGACCFEDGSCQILTAQACSGGGGVYLGHDSTCDPNPCGFGACCFPDGRCEFLERDRCQESGGFFLSDGTPCNPNPCPGGGGGCKKAGVWEEQVVLARQVALARNGRERRLAVETGTGTGTLRDGSPGYGCGTLLFNSDTSYENGYAWSYGGVVAPYYGAFAEGYATPSLQACSIILDLTQIGNSVGQTLDVYAWEDAGGVPGAVLNLVTGRNPGPIAFWPSVSRHVFSLPFNGDCADATWTGYWGNWPGAVAGWYIGADLDGFGGLSMTMIAPGIGYPTGWNYVSIIWGPTCAIGCGGEFMSCGATPVRESSWGEIKALFR